MSSRDTNLRYFMYFSSFFVSTVALLLLSALHTTNGGLLSAYVRNRNLHNLIQQPVSENQIETSREERLPSPSSSYISSESSLLRIQTSYTDCGSAASIKKLTLSPCANADDSGICEIERGSNVTFSLSFVPKWNATHLKSVIHGIVDLVPIPLPCPEPDACQNSGITCPIQSGSQYDYQLSAQIKDSYPRMKLWVKGQLEDEEERNVICVKFHVHIV